MALSSNYKTMFFCSNRQILTHTSRHYFTRWNSGKKICYLFHACERRIRDLIINPSYIPLITTTILYLNTIWFKATYSQGNPKVILDNSWFRTRFLLPFMTVFVRVVNRTDPRTIKNYFIFIFKVFTKFPEWRSDEENLKNS